jgi:hypothetical protein
MHPSPSLHGRAEESETKTLSGERSLALDPTTWQALAEYIIDWQMERELLGQDTRLLFVWSQRLPYPPRHHHGAVPPTLCSRWHETWGPLADSDRD